MGLPAILLRIIHYILSFRSIFIQCLVGAKKWYSIYYWKGPTDLVGDSKTLQKLPIHVGILLTEENISFSDIAAICVWCIGMGVSYISLFDPEGIFKRNQSLLHKQIVHLCSQTSDSKNSQPTVCIYSGIDSKSHQQKEVYKSNQVIIHLHSLEDGTQYLVKKTKQLCETMINQQSKPSDITLSNVQRHLEDQQGFPDPDLLLRFGAVDSTLGYLPWHIRLSEILSLPTHHGIDYKTFLQTLESYAYKEQRFGK